jgi:hypothetical protein
VRWPRRVPQPLRLVARGELEERIERERAVVDPCPHVSELLEPGGTLAKVRSPGSTVSISAQVTGQLTFASGLARTE